MPLRSRLSAVALASSAPTMRPSPQLINPVDIATRPTMAAAPAVFPGRLDSHRMKARTGRLWATAYPVTRIRLICMLKPEELPQARAPPGIEKLHCRTRPGYRDEAARAGDGIQLFDRWKSEEQRENRGDHGQSECENEWFRYPASDRGAEQKADACDHGRRVRKTRTLRGVSVW